MAYAFLTTKDVLARIRDEHRNELADNTESIELTAESQAIAKVKSYLHGRFDMSAMYAATGDARDPLLVLHTLNIFLYLLYRRVNPRKMPDEVKDDHSETLEWLSMVAKGEVNPDFPPLPDDAPSTTDLRFGGPPAMGGHYF